MDDILNIIGDSKDQDSKNDISGGKDVKESSLDMDIEKQKK